MTRLSLINLALLLGVAALAALAYFRPVHDEAATRALSTRLPAQAQRVRIEREGNPAIVIERQNAIWRIVEPLRAEADVEQMQRMLGILTAHPIQRFDASRLARFELERPRARLAIDDESYQFGLVNPVSGEQYVLAGGAVHVIASRYGAALPLHAVDIARRQVLSRTELPVRFEAAEFTLRQENGQWVRLPPRESVSHDALAEWVEFWHTAGATRVSPLVPRPYAAVLRIGLGSGASIALGIVQREPELVIAREDEKLQYHFPAASVRRLLVPPGEERATPAKSRGDA